MKKISAILLILFLSFTNKIQASHALGGDISYTDLGNGNYEVVFTLYRDCSGIPAPTTVSLEVSSVSASYTQTFTLTLDNASTRMLQLSCPTVLNSCQGGTLLGIE